MSAVDPTAAIVPSRTPADYRPSSDGHFTRRLKERKIPGYAIAECITDGSAESLSAGRVALVSDSHTVIVNTRKMEAETVYRGSP